jgi:ribosomal protein S18 acetylase RimI-like enzyme
MATDSLHFHIREATLADLEGEHSLLTILPRAFHPINPYMKSVIPDTPKVRDWWLKIFGYCINNEGYQVLIATTTTAEPTGNEAQAVKHDHDEVIGVLLLHYVDSSNESAKENCWTLYPPTSDHDQTKFNAMLGVDETNKSYNPPPLNNPENMRTSPHFLIEFFCTDHSYQGKGVGTAVLKKACEIVDANGIEMTVVANWTATGFYERVGFKEEARVRMPGEEEYWECLLARPAAKAG